MDKKEGVWRDANRVTSFYRLPTGAEKGMIMVSNPVPKGVKR
jgi:hypothetical protein